MLFNIPLPDVNSSNKSDFNSIKGYLSALNDQLRFLMVNIDEENLSENLLNNIKSTSNAIKNWALGNQIDGNKLADGTVPANKLPVDNMQRNDLTSNPYGLSIGKELSMNSNGEICSIGINPNGLLSFSQGADTVPFSLALFKSDDQYFFYLVNSEGRIIGTIPVQNVI